jgi:hypothetical protein
LFQVELICGSLTRQLECAEFTIAKSAVIQGPNMVAVPWDSLDSVSLRRELLLNSEPFSHLKTLDPIRMSPHEIYSVLALLLQAQNSGFQLLEFSIGDIFNSGKDVEQGVNEPTDSPRDVSIDNATTELNIDSPIQTRRLPAKRMADSEICTASARDNSMYNDATTAPLVIDQPQLTPPLSKSMIKAAIENVAKAGYLSISDATGIDSPNQVLQHLKTASQQRGEAKTSDSNSRKRGREEMEQDLPNENKQMKRHRAKVAVPTREQSSRYDFLTFSRLY